METNKNLPVFILLKNQGIPLGDIIPFLLRLRRKPISTLAKDAGVTRQFVGRVLAGKKKSEKVELVITRALGFNPFKYSEVKGPRMEGGKDAQSNPL